MLVTGCFQPPLYLPGADCGQCRRYLRAEIGILDEKRHLRSEFYRQHGPAGMSIKSPYFFKDGDGLIGIDLRPPAAGLPCLFGPAGFETGRLSVQSHQMGFVLIDQDVQGIFAVVSGCCGELVQDGGFAFPVCRAVALSRYGGDFTFCFHI